MPKIEGEECEGKKTVSDEEKVHQLKVLLV
jgi:hypothetical protein